MDVKQELEKVKQEMKNANNALVPKTETVPETTDLLRDKKTELLKSEEVQKLGEMAAKEDIKADFKSEAARINQKNIDTAEREFDNETRQRRLDRLNAEMDLQHKYNMSMIKANAEHNQMLDKRKKMVEKYGYLYDNKEAITAQDGEGNEYKVPKDFSYSVVVNKMRQFGRNISKLDKPILQTIKWFLIFGIGIALIFILKGLGILN